MYKLLQTWEQAKTQKPVGETNFLSNWDLPLPQYNPGSKPEGVDKINIDKISIYPNSAQEEPLQVTDSMISPPTTDKEEKTTTQEKMHVGKDNNQQEGEEYEA